MSRVNRGSRGHDLAPACRAKRLCDGVCVVLGVAERFRCISCERWVIADLVDLADPGPLEPVAKERRLEVAAELRPKRRPPDGACVDDCCSLAASFEEMAIAALDIDVEDPARL